MEIDDTAWSVEEKAAVIHRQLGEIEAPVPVYKIARALGISDIEERKLSGIQGCLVTNPERSGGVIMVNKDSRPFRRRYTVGHELGHYLCNWHRASDQGFLCSPRDMMTTTAGDQPRDLQEAEANRFAIELLAP